MSVFKRIFGVFSQRPEAQLKSTHDVPNTTRNRVLLWCGELYSNSRDDFSTVGKGDYRAEFWQEIHKRLLLRTGQLQLPASGRVGYPNDAIDYILKCPGEQFLDFLEDIFSVDCFFHVNMGDDKVVDELNFLLNQDKLPYSLTHFVKETVRETTGHYAGRDAIYTRAYPKVIMKESELLHISAVEPTLMLLSRHHFVSANKEYLAAHEDYRKGDFADCLTKCGSAFESVLKVICDRKGWKYSQNDTANTLIKTVLPKTSLDTYFEQLLLIVATLRNRLSSAHGAGTTAKLPSSQIAQYSLNATASAILLIARETGEG